MHVPSPAPLRPGGSRQSDRPKTQDVCDSLQAAFAERQLPGRAVEAGDGL